MGWLLLAIAVGLVVIAIQHWQITIIIAGVGVIIFILYKMNKASEARQEAQRQHQATQEAVRQNLVSYINKAVTVFEGLPELVKIAERALDKAEEEFEDGAFAPFWDAVEHAVTHLARFDEGIKQILSYSDGFKVVQKNYDSTPPAFSLNIHGLPDASSTSERMRGVVRRAQKSFQFATIYEQRKTNQILVQGFQSLGQALSDMTYRIESSMEALSQSFSDSISDLAKSNRESAQNIVDQLKSDSDARRSHERKERDMLDNIQRGRKPSI